MLESMRSTEQSQEIETFASQTGVMAGANLRGPLPKPEKRRLATFARPEIAINRAFPAIPQAVSLAFPQCFPQVWKSWGRNRTERGDALHGTRPKDAREL